MPFERPSRSLLLTRWPARPANRGLVMSNWTVEVGQSEEEIFDQNVADDVLEAAGSLNERASGYTLAYCSGLSVCPA